MKSWDGKKVEEKKLTVEEQAKADRKESIALRKECAEQNQIIHILKRDAAVFSADQLKYNTGWSKISTSLIKRR